MWMAGSDLKFIISFKSDRLRTWSGDEGLDASLDRGTVLLRGSHHSNLVSNRHAVLPTKKLIRCDSGGPLQRRSC